MKRIFFAACLIILLLLTGCGQGDVVTITAEPDSYSPSMSSVRGITMTPNFITDNSYENIVYHWKTSVGEFIGVGKEAINQGEPVTWSAVEDGKEVGIDEPITINLAVIDSDNEVILTFNSLTIIPENGYFKVGK